MASLSDWQVSPQLQPKPEDFDFDLDAALAAMVALRATVPADAFTAETLGTERAGHGVIIRENGIVLTIGYLITEADSIWLHLGDGRGVPGHALGYDQEPGFGLVRAFARLDLPALPIGESSTAEIGDRVVVAGAGGRHRSVAARIADRHEFAGYWEYVLDEALFTAPAHPNMVVPIDLLKPVLDDLLTYGRRNRPPRPWLGLYASEIEDRVVVVGLASGGPAHRAKLHAGDIVLAVGGMEVRGLAGFFRRIWSLGHAGVEVPLLVYRDGRTFELRIASGDRNRFLKGPRLH